MSYYTPVVYDQRLTADVALMEEKVLLARAVIRRLGGVIVIFGVERAAGHIGVLNGALAQAQQALDDTQARAAAGTSARAVELLQECALVEMWLDDAITRSVTLEAALVASDASGALAVLPDLDASLADCQTAIRLAAGVIDGPLVTAIRLEDLALLATVDDPLPVLTARAERRRVLPPASIRVERRLVEAILVRVRHAEEVAESLRLTARLVEARRAQRVPDVVQARVLVGVRL